MPRSALATTILICLFGAQVSSAQTFADVPSDYWAYPQIEVLAASGISGGCGAGNYCPEGSVTRAQMAVFLERGMRGPAFQPPPASGTLFQDVGSTDFAAGYIEQLYQDGVTGGCGSNNYCPSESVSRAQMAVFLLRAKHGAMYLPPPATGAFSDVPPGYWAAPWIEQLSTEGITGGCGGGNFCPEQRVTRAQMAVFLSRTFQLSGALLTSLELSPFQLDQQFDPLLTNYTANASFLQASATLAFTALPSASVEINGIPVDPGTLSVQLQEGQNTIVITVSDTSSNTTSYVVDVSRETSDVFAQAAYLKASNTDPGDTFGISIALSGDTLAVGAEWESSSATGINGNEEFNNPSGAGAAYVFVRDTEGSWTQQAYVKASNTGFGDHFGSAVAISGDTLAVAARGEKSAATGINGDQSNNELDRAGAVYIFVRDELDTWSQQAYIKASNTDAVDIFGGDIALDGDTLAVSAFLESSCCACCPTNNSTFAAGAAYIFVRDEFGGWSQQAYIKASNPDTNDDFGRDLDLSGDTLAVNALGEDSAATGINGDQADNSAENSGAVYVFTRDAQQVWSQQAYVKASNTEAGDGFGLSVALSGDTLVVGAHMEDSSASGIDGDDMNNSAENSGAVYVFTRDHQQNWSQQTYIKSSNSEAGDAFGAHVDIEGNVMAVGAGAEDSSSTGINGNQFDNNMNGSGAVYLFVRDEFDTWSQFAYIKASVTDIFDAFGAKLSLSGNALAVGVPAEDSAATGVNGDQTNNDAESSGAALIFD